MQNHEVVDYNLEDVFEQSETFGYGDVQIVQRAVHLIQDAEVTNKQKRIRLSNN